MSPPDQGESGLRSLIGAELWSLATSRRAAPVRAIVLTQLPSERSGRASFRLTYADGGSLKGRIMRDAESAGRVAALHTLLDARHAPALLGREGPALLTEWVDGSAPDGGDDAVLRRAGAMLAALHGTPVPTELAQRYGFRQDAWADRLQANLSLLVARGALSAELRDLALARARESRPAGRPPAGLVHCDVCPENLIVGDDGELTMIDNENLTIDALPFDLARTSYRWPLRGAAEAFWQGYRRTGDPTPFQKHRDYWMIQALAEAAAFRVAGQTTGARVPLAALLRVVDGVDAGSPESR